ncbi:hypothetical protein [Cyclobacterium marinum]|uniref:Uncharacterized protein n=1 Tax=Cyclobacterium marinum (strain ATCC 25205 / DSM 745 / LMG 13164 / NCIMB 1802) TaxID=880070 RepID=G0IY10_CYCMS|nr:hypothetical protein [Cyclobacterium marinum]AEL24343.1 hypothetical protein Cycma_0568 [Cyclobacterium marinum DSM 745]
MSNKAQTKSQKKAMNNITKLAEINVLDLGKGKIGISIKSDEKCNVNDLGHSLMNLLDDLKECLKQKGVEATMADFDQWQNIKRKK